MNLAKAGPLEPVTALGELSIRRLTSEEAAFLVELRELGSHRLLLDFGADPAEAAAWVATRRRGPYALPMLLERSGQPVGVAFTAFGSPRNLNAFAMAALTDYGQAARHLALYVRHVFWNFPVRRLYSQVPAVPALEEVAAAFAGAGFTEEGRLLGHVLLSGRPVDVIAMGLLREDFEAWCREHESELALD